MITLYTVTLNPVVDVIYRLPRFEKGETVLCDEYAMVPAGKGLNVSYALSYMGVESDAFIVLGEGDLSLYKHECKRHKIKLRAVSGNFTVRRHCTLLETDPPSVTHVRNAGSPVPNAALEELIDDLERHVNMEDIVILSGSLPPGADPGLYKEIVSRCKHRGATSILDSSGEALRRGLEAHPFVVKINQAEAEEITGKRIQSLQDEFGILQALHRISRSRLVIITLGAKGMIAGSEDGMWRMKAALDPARVVDTVGCGDSMTAGLVYGFHKGLSTEDALRHAVAFASASAMKIGPAQIEPAAVRELLGKVEVSHMGSL